MPMTTTNAAADHDHTHLFEPDAIASAIASGKDLGVFELCAAVAKAREAIPLGVCPRTPAAVRAAVGIRAAFEKVAAGIAEIDSVPQVCPCCQLREQLDRLIEVAAGPVSGEDADDSVREEGLVDACKELAYYAGDEHPDEDATRAVLELARDVFVAAFAAASPELRP